MSARHVTSAMLLGAYVLLVAGCVSVPIPPSDMGKTKRGELGTLVVKVVAEYKPNWAGTIQAAMRNYSNTSDGKAVIK